MDGGRAFGQVVGQMLHLCIGQTNVTFLATGQTKVVASQGWANVMVRQTSYFSLRSDKRRSVKSFGIIHYSVSATHSVVLLE